MCYCWSSPRNLAQSILTVVLSLLPLFSHTDLFPLFRSFLYLSLMSCIQSHAPSFISSVAAVLLNETFRSLSGSIDWWKKLQVRMGVARLFMMKGLLGAMSVLAQNYYRQEKLGLSGLCIIKNKAFTFCLFCCVKLLLRTVKCLLIKKRTFV